jgi:hypothetical protein
VRKRTNRTKALDTEGGETGKRRDEIGIRLGHLAAVLRVIAERQITRESAARTNDTDSSG